MNITKNTVTFTAEEYKGIMLRFSDVLTTHLNLVRAIAEEETLRQKHRSYLETRAKIFGSILDNEDMIDDACKLVDKHLGYCELCGAFDSDSEVSFENRPASCHECGKKAEETDNIEQAKDGYDAAEDSAERIKATAEKVTEKVKEFIKENKIIFAWIGAGLFSKSSALISPPPSEKLYALRVIYAKSPLDWGLMRGKNLMKSILEDVYAFLFSKSLVSRVWQ